jgi:hypothetical protein
MPRNALLESVARHLREKVAKTQVTALCKRVWYRIFVESRAERGSQQKFWFYISAKRCIPLLFLLSYTQ